jgi:hypothetical protein
MEIFTDVKQQEIYRIIQTAKEGWGYNDSDIFKMLNEIMVYMRNQQSDNKTN